MKYTNIMFIALALCMVLAVAPVTAVWENGNWVESSDATHDAQTGVDSKYVATSAFDVVQPIDKLTGTLRGSIRCGYNTLTKEIGIRNDANPDGVNGTFMYIPIKPDGTFEEQLIPGSYTLYLKDGNGGQPETSHAIIIAGQLSQPMNELNGHAVSGDDAAHAHKIVYTILKASYGMQKKVIDQPYVPGVPAVPGTPDTYEYVGHNHGNYDRHSFWGNVWYTYEGNNHGDYIKHCGTPGTPAIPAIPEVSHVEGTYITVTSNVQEAVDKGYTNFLFNNAKNPGGIFDVSTTTLLSTIVDPSGGQVKSILIDYTVDGVDKNIDTMEYETIIL